MMNQKIPKIIHYCWFGGNPLPELAQKCIASWKKYCPEYEIREWNESNFDLNCCDYVREAYEAKKWAFVSDVARLYALVNYGGIYMDTDVEVVKPLDPLLQYDAVSGFQTDVEIPTGLMACEKGNIMFQELLDDYKTAHFIFTDGSYDLTTNVTRITNTCLKYGFVADNKKQTVNSLVLLPKDYLCAKNHLTGKLEVTENTIAVHHFNGSWLPKEEIYRRQMAQKIYKVFPVGSGKVISLLCGFIAYTKFYGIMGSVKKCTTWITNRI